MDENIGCTPLSPFPFHWNHCPFNEKLYVYGNQLQSIIYHSVSNQYWWMPQPSSTLLIHVYLNIAFEAIPRNLNLRIQEGLLFGAPSEFGWLIFSMVWIHILHKQLKFKDKLILIRICLPSRQDMQKLFIFCINSHDTTNFFFLGYKFRFFPSIMAFFFKFCSTFSPKSPVAG